MKKQIEVEVVKDSGTPDSVASVGYKELQDVTCCDICEKIIDDGQNIGTEEDFCSNCFEQRLIRPHMRLVLGWSEDNISDEMKLIIVKFNNLKKHGKTS